MSTHVVGRLLAFRNLADGDEICDHETLVQVTDARSDGCVEIAFDMPAAPGKPRVYLTLPLGEIVRAAVVAQPSKVD
jgi:hypothetical protein